MGMRAGRRRVSRQRLMACAAYAAALELVARQGLAEMVAGTYRAGQPVRRGRQRSSERTVAIHLAREAFGAPLADISRAAGCLRHAARQANLRVWSRRDLHPEIDTALWQATQQLKGEMTHG